MRDLIDEREDRRQITSEPDTVATLQDAGLKQVVPDLNQILTSNTQQTAQPQTLDIGKPQDLGKSLLLNQDLLKNLAASRQQAFDLGEASSYFDPGVDFGGYTFKQLGSSFDETGNQIGGGFTAFKKDTAPSTQALEQLGVAGRPVETTYTYDTQGNVIGSEQRFFKGGDSGIVINFDASGSPIGAQKFDYSESWKQTALPIANIALMAATAGLGGPLQAALQPTFGQLGSQIATQALFGAGRGAILGGLTGQDIGSSIAKGAVAGGASPLIGSLGELAGKEVSNLVGSFAPQTSFGDFLQTLSGDVAKDIVRQVGGSAVGSMLTGRDFDLGSAVAGGALSGLTTSVLNEVKGNPAIKALPKELQGTALAALSAKLRGRDPGPAALNALIGSVVNQVGRGTPTGGGSTGGDFQTSSFWEGWDPSGGEGLPIDVADQRVELPQTREFTPDSSATEAVSDLFKPTTKTTAPQQKVEVTGNRIATGDQFLDDLLSDVFAATNAQTKPADQSVVVQSKTLPTETAEVTTAPGTVTTTAPTQKVDVSSTKLPSETVQVTSTKLPPDQKVEVTDKKIPPTVTPSPSTTKSVAPSAGILGLMPLLSQPSQPAQQTGVLPLADVFYGRGAVKFGPDAGRMADPTDFQGRMAQAKEAMELALEGEGGENRAEDAYDRLMALADERPAETVDALMQMIKRG